MDTTIKTKTVKFGTKNYEIPAHMDKSGMVECWEHEANVLEKLAQDIVENHKYFASEIVHRWLEKHGQQLIDKDYRGFIGHTDKELREMTKRYSETENNLEA